jgi:hypothetical protein
MHDGCSGSFESGKQVVDKVRSMGFDQQFMPVPLRMACDCGHTFDMEKFVDECPICHMVFGVTPCHAFDAEHVLSAGANY